MCYLIVLRSAFRDYHLVFSGQSISQVMLHDAQIKSLFPYIVCKYHVNIMVITTWWSLDKAWEAFHRCCEDNVTSLHDVHCADIVSFSLYGV